MSDEDRSMNLIGRGIGDRPVFKPPPNKSKDVKPSQIPDSSPAYEVSRAEVEARRKLKLDVRSFSKNMIVKRKRKHVKRKNAQNPATRKNRRKN